MQGTAGDSVLHFGILVLISDDPSVMLIRLNLGLRFAVADNFLSENLRLAAVTHLWIETETVKYSEEMVYGVLSESY